MKVLYVKHLWMNMIPPAIAMFSSMLKKDGHKVEIFDTTYYQTDHGIDSDGSKMERLNVVPYKMDKDALLKKSDWRLDLKTQVQKFKPDLFAISATEDMWELGIKIIEEVKDYKLKNNIPVIAGGVFSTFAPDLCIKHELIDLVCVGEGENALKDICNKIEKRLRFFKYNKLLGKKTVK